LLDSERAKRDALAATTRLAADLQAARKVAQ